ncbi:NifU family protein [Vibrio sp. PP-XX7]
MAATDVLTEQAVLTGQTAEDSATKVEVLTGQTSEDLVPKVEVLTGQTTEDLASRVDETDQSENERIWVMIEQVIARMRPGVVADGGDIQLVDVDDNMVFIAMSGSCMGCGLSGLTLANLEQKISKALNRQYIVFPVQGK